MSLEEAEVATPTDDARAALEEEREFLLASLGDLEREHDAGDLADDDYVLLRDEYTARAAAVLRAIDALGEATGGAGPADLDVPGVPPGTTPDDLSSAQPAAAARRRRGGTVLAVVAVVAFGVLAGTLVARFSGTRGAGDLLTGGVPAGPSTLKAEARSRLGSDRAGALALYDRVLALRPDDPEALAYKGWVTALEGDALAGEALVDQAIAADGTYADARAFKGILRNRAGDPRSALVEFDRFLALQSSPELFALVAEPRRQATVAILDSARANLASDPVAALRDYEAVLASSPGESEALAGKGFILSLTGQDDLVEEGLRLISEALKADPPFALAHYYRGEILLDRQRDCAGAAAAYQAFLDTGPPEDEAATARQRLDAANACR